MLALGCSFSGTALRAGPLSGSRCAAEESSRVEVAEKGSLEPCRLWNGEEELLPVDCCRCLRNGQERERPQLAGQQWSSQESGRRRKEEVFLNHPGFIESGGPLWILTEFLQWEKFTPGNTALWGM